METAEQLCNKTVVRLSGIHRFGVFAAQNIKNGELVDQCVGLIFRFPDRVRQNNLLNDYIFEDADTRKSVILLGNGCIYNHANRPNLERYCPHDEDDCVHDFMALRPIKKGQELFIDYGKDYWTARGIVPSSPPRRRSKRRKTTRVK